MTKQVIIIGGGASGMIAGISARRQGAKVIILERNPRVGKKLLATGNGRCNFTNINANVNCYNGNNPKFVYGALTAFSVEETLRFFKKMGIQYKIEDFGRVYPMSDQASSVLDVLLYELNQLGVEIICNAYVTDVSKKNNKFLVQTEDGKVYEGDRVILTTGGKAMPSSGSDGNGIELAKKLGHTSTVLFPALVQLMLEGPYFKRLSGVKFVGKAEVIYQNKSIAQDKGDILFTNYGISGPPILQISRKAGELLNSKKEVYLKVSIMDGMSMIELKELIKERIRLNGSKPVDFSFVGLINKRLIPVVLAEAGIKNFNRPVSGLSNSEIESITRILLDWRFPIRGTKGWTSAQVTAGGINTKEINPNTMESILVKGLFFAGEILDIDGLCGGYNLQWSWSSGFTAGLNASW